jgi:hypothetical protein
LGFKVGVLHINAKTSLKILAKDHGRMQNSHSAKSFFKVTISTGHEIRDVTEAPRFFFFLFCSMAKKEKRPMVVGL